MASVQADTWEYDKPSRRRENPMFAADTRLEPEHVTWQPLIPNPGQARFIDNTTSRDVGIHCFVGGAGAGKSQGLCQPAQECCVSLPGNEIGVARKFARDLRRTTYREFMRAVPTNWIFEERKVDMELVLRTSNPDVNSRITFFGLDDTARLGSMQFGQVFVDEANEMEYEDFLTLRQRLRHRLPDKVNPSKSPFAFRGGGKWRMVHFIALACNPIPIPDHWLRQLYCYSRVGQKRFERTMVRVSTFDNRANLDDEYIAILEDMPESERRRMLLGEDTAGVVGDACTPSFDRDRHVFRGSVPELPVTIVRGWDFGWRHASVHWATVVDKSAIYIWRENFAEKMTLRETVTHHVLPTQAEFHTDCEFTDYVDHQARNQHTDKSEETSAGIMRDCGLRPRSSYSKPRERAELLDDLLRAGRLFVHESCEKTICALGGYWHREKDSDEPEKDGYFEHVGDSLGYLAHGVFGSKGRRIGREVDSALREADEDSYEPKYPGLRQRGFATPGMGLGRRA